MMQEKEPFGEKRDEQAGRCNPGKQRTPDPGDTGRQRPSIRQGDLRCLTCWTGHLGYDFRSWQWCASASALFSSWQQADLESITVVKGKETMNKNMFKSKGKPGND